MVLIVLLALLVLKVRYRCSIFFCGSSLNAFTSGNPFWGTTLLGFSIGRGLRVLKGLKNYSMLYKTQKPVYLVGKK